MKILMLMVVMIVWEIIVCYNAPVGYEDENGYHDGEQPEDRG